MQLKTSSSKEPDKLKLLVMNNMKSASIFGGACKKYVLGMQASPKLSVSQSLDTTQRKPLEPKNPQQRAYLHNLFFKFAHPKIATS
jgi:hypothetical protein